MDEAATPTGKLVNDIVMRLVDVLCKYEDVESAIAVYKEVASYLDKLKSVQAQAKQLAEDAMRQTGECHVKTEVGSAGWTDPKAKKLDAAAWQKALIEDERLRDVSSKYDLAKARLESAQSEFMVTPERAFYIR